MKNKSLSIIVPIYNVEKYVRPCLESIFKQGLDDDVFELILVNDGTEDRSMEVIADIIAAHGHQSGELRIIRSTQQRYCNGQRRVYTHARLR